MTLSTPADPDPPGGEESAAPPPSSGEDSDGPATPPQAIRQRLASFHDAFDRGAIRETLPFVHRPCMVVTRWGAYVLADGAEVESAFASVRRHLVAAGCQRTERRHVAVRLLGDRLAQAGVLTLRFDAEDRELERSGTSYVLRRTDGGWCVAVLVEHDAGQLPATG